MVVQATSPGQGGCGICDLLHYHHSRRSRRTWWTDVDRVRERLNYRFQQLSHQCFRNVKTQGERTKWISVALFVWTLSWSTCVHRALLLLDTLMSASMQASRMMCCYMHMVTPSVLCFKLCTNKQQARTWHTELNRDLGWQICCQGFRAD